MLSPQIYQEGDIDEFTPLLEEVALDQNREIPVLRGLTRKIVEGLYCHIERIFEEEALPIEPFDKMETFVYNLVEHQAKLGVIATELNIPTANLYDIGCGLAIPSLVYARISGKKVTAFDPNKEDLERAARFASQLGVGKLVDLVQATAQDFFRQRPTQPKDTLILSSPENYIAPVILEFLFDRGINMIHSFCAPPHLIDNQYLMHEYLNFWYLSNGYDLKLATTRNFPQGRVCIAKKK